MNPFDLLVYIERYISIKGISHDDSIEDLLDALAADGMEEL